MQAVCVDQNSKVTLENIPEPKIGAGEALIRTQGCGICGTDLLKIHGKLVKSKTVLGHELVGTIEQIGAGVTQYSVGDRIVAAHHVPCFDCHYCRHDAPSMCATFKATNFEPGGFAPLVRLSAAHLQHATFKLPNDMSWEEAIFTEPLACCERNLDRLNLKSGDTVVIVGLGSIGLMTAALLKLRGVKTIGLDTDASRLPLAKEFGIDAGFAAANDDFKTAIQNFSNSRGADVVVLTAGPAALANTAINWVRPAGIINVFSHLAGENAPLDLAAVYHHELTVLSSYSASPKSLKAAFEILRDKNLNLRRLLAPAYAPENFSQAIDDVAKRKIYKAVIQFAES